MNKHRKIYKDYFNYSEQDFVPCEVCGSAFDDIHHIEAKRMGGSKTKDYIENLISLCRDCHTSAHASKITVETLKALHMQKMGIINHTAVIRVCFDKDTNTIGTIGDGSDFIP